MAKLVFFAAVLVVFVALSAAEGNNILQVPCQRQLQQSSLDACRRVVEHQLATQRPFFLSPQALTASWVQAQCCQQLRDISHECRAAAIRQIVRQYEHQVVVSSRDEPYYYGEGHEDREGGSYYPGGTYPQQEPGWEQHQQEQGSFQPSETFPQQQGQGSFQPSETFPQQQQQEWYRPSQTFQPQQEQWWYGPSQTFPQQQEQGWYPPSQTFPQQGQRWYLPSQTFPQQQGQGLYHPGLTFPHQQDLGWYHPSQTYPHQQQQGGGLFGESTAQLQQQQGKQKSFGSSDLHSIWRSIFHHDQQPAAGHESFGKAAQQQKQGSPYTSETFPQQQHGGGSFGKSTTKQQKGRQDPYCLGITIYRHGQQPAQHELGETAQQEGQGQYSGKQIHQTGFGELSSPPHFGTEQQAAHLRVVARARQVAAQLPAMCRLEGSAFSASY